MKPNLSRRRAVLTCVLFALVATGICVALNWPSDFKQYQRTQIGTHAGPMEAGLYGDRSTLRRAGWPWNYRIEIAVNNDSERVKLLYRSTTNLIKNLFVGLGVVAVVAFYTWRRYRSVASSPHPNRTRFRYDACSAMVCLLIPATVYLLSNRTARNHLEITRDLARFGQCNLSVELPDWLASIVPSAMQHAFLRLRTVQVVSPPMTLLDSTLDKTTLRGLRILDANLEPRDLAKLQQLHELTEISLENCQFTCETVRVLSNHDALRTLTLRHCSLGPPELAELNRLRNLERVDFSFATVKLSEFKQPGWASSVRSLRLPSPPHDREDRLEIRDWIELRDLGLQADRTSPSMATVELDLAACPSLKSLYLPASQRFSIQATELPALEGILEPVETFPTRDLDFPLLSLPRWKNVRLHRVSHLTRFECDADELINLDLSAAQRLQEFAIGKTLYSPIHLQLREPTEYEKSLDWIRAVGRLPHVRSLSIDGVRLNEDHLSLIADFPALRSLTLTNADLTNEMLDPIAGMQSLRDLHLQLCRIDGRRMNQFLEFKHLKKLTADLSGLDQLDVSNHTRLREISTAPLQNLKSLKLRNLPMLTSPVVVQQSIDRLRVINTPRLTELTIECPWPSDYRLQRIDSLVRFAAGGPEVNDRLTEQLLCCKRLDQLVLAYASLSPEMLGRIAEVANLTALEVPGSDLDDGVTRQWITMKRLRRICLDDTRISDQTCEWFRSLESLRSLSLQRLQLSELGCRHVASLRLLSDLSLVGTPFPAPMLAGMVDLGGLELLDISGHEITEELVEAISRSRVLRTVTLLRCELSVQQMERMLSSNEQLLLIHDVKMDRLEALPEHLRERVYSSVDHFAENHPFVHSHRISILTSHMRQHGGGRMMISRPFAVEQFRPRDQLVGK